MDEVFGNSSTETVVSVHDLDTKSSPDNNEVAKSVPDNPSSDDAKENCGSEGKSTVETRCEVDSMTITESKGECPTNRVSVIKCASSLPMNQEADKAVFKVPLLPAAPLRHAQSAVVPRPFSAVCSRVRAHSTTATVQSTVIVLKHHPYQNIPLNASSLPHMVSFPSYANLPEHRARRSCNTKVGSPSKLNKTNSAPSTPRGSRNPASPRVNHSYIQLWTGVQQEEPAASDQDSSQQLTGAGYVSMSSPYVRSPNSSILSDLANQLSSHTGISKSRDIYCPFCPRPFTQELNLKHHIQAIHRHELQVIAQDRGRVEVQLCPLCRTRFFNLTLLPSHLLEFHRESVVDILEKHETIRIDGNEIRCPFCVKKVPTSKLGEDILLYHVLQLHCTEYERLIRFLFEPLECVIRQEPSIKLSTEDLAHVLSFKPGLTSTPGLSLKFKDLSFEVDAASHDSGDSGSHTDLEETWSSHCARRTSTRKAGSADRLENQMMNKGILRSHTDLSRKPNSVKRELRFSVPPVTSEEFFVPESPESQDSSRLSNAGEEELVEQDENECPTTERRNIPVRIDSLSSADFIEMTNLPRRKRRSLGIGLKSKKSFKKKKRETSHLVENVFDGLKSIGCGKPPPPPPNQVVITTSATRTFRKPKPVSPPTVPAQASVVAASTRSAAAVSVPVGVLRQTPPPPSSSQLQMRYPHAMSSVDSSARVPAPVQVEETSSDTSPFGSMKLYSPLRMFRCNSCRVKFCDNDSLGSHIRGRHRGFLGLLRPQFGCGICSAKFYENKYLVKHCLQHHTSLLEIRSPKKHKITIYRLSQD